ncbi:OPT oligopeptide transporter protein-domain-containing protein [Obelidium mucronatum]|nr:OPT oligopeptide transporter protein-domain-containing protein [Obelidium mucronatum]
MAYQQRRYSIQDSNGSRSVTPGLYGFAGNNGNSKVSIDHEREPEQEDVDDSNSIYATINCLVPRTDDPSLPALTFRVWIIGLLLGSLLSIGNTVFSFHTSSFAISSLVATLVAYPFGVLLSKILPNGGFLNPAPFSIKEHALIYVMINTMATIPYAINNIVGEKYLLQQELTLVSCFAFVIITQCFGYGFAGLTRRFLVRPATMSWPGNFSIIAMLRALHRADDSLDSLYPMVRSRYFVLAALLMFFWQILPGYVAPALAALSVLCWFTTSNKIAVLLGSTAPGAGVGFLSFTLDWSLISATNPITTPLWATLNMFGGLYLFLWVIVPILWSANAFGMDQKLGASSSAYGFLLNSGATFNKNGIPVSRLNFLGKDDNQTWVLNTPFYEANKPIYITTYYAVEWANSFLVFVAVLVHVFLWYGRDLWIRFRTSLAELDMDDVHVQMMENYEQVPDWWFYGLIGVCSAGSILLGYFGGFQLPWWGTFLAIGLVLLAILPFGIIQAISGQQLGLGVIAEMIIGFLIPGNISGVMAFKTLSLMSMYQGLSFVLDLKLGHYMKIPPRSMFVVQVVAAILGAIVSTGTTIIMFNWFGKTDSTWNLQSSSGAWNSNNYNIYISGAAMWGAIGPARFFGPGSPYFSTLIGFPLGLALPVIPWILHQLNPTSFWHLINIPLIFIFPAQIGTRRSDLITPLLVAVLFNYYIKKYRTAWWYTYAYVTSAAFDAGCTVVMLLIFLLSQMVAGYLIPFPHWFLNSPDIERCLPNSIIECQAHQVMGNAYGNVYNASLDAVCS